MSSEKHSISAAGSTISREKHCQPVDINTSASTSSYNNAPEAGPAIQAHPSWKFFLITMSLLFGTFLIALDETILGTAIPNVTSDFQSLDDIAWYSAGYIVTLTALQPTFGKLYRLMNVKWVYLVCVVIFEVGSIICAAAPTSVAFIVGRAIAGCGGAGILQGSLAIITNTVPLAKRPLYNSIILSSFVICVCVGPLLGGAFTQNVTWRWCFWINVPIGGLVFGLILVFLRLDSNSVQKEFRSVKFTRKLKELDLTGTTLIIGATVCLLLALQWGGVSRPWKSATVIGLLVGAGLLGIAFFLVQWKLGEKALIPFHIWRKRSILAGSLILFFFAMPTYIYSYYIAIYFQSAKGATPIRSAVNFLSIGLPQIVSVVISGALTTAFGIYVPFLIGGTVIAAIGAGFITTIDINTPTGHWVGIFIVYAVGTGFAINVPYTAVQAILKEVDVPTGNAIFQFFFQLGASIGLSISQAVLLNRLQDQIRTNLPQIDPQSVIDAGAYNLDRIADSPSTLRQLRETYSESLSALWIYPLAAACVTVTITLFMEHKNIKVVAKQRENEENGTAGSEGSSA